jgi:hypothetical protein
VSLEKEERTREITKTRDIENKGRRPVCVQRVCVYSVDCVCGSSNFKYFSFICILPSD